MGSQPTQCGLVGATRRRFVWSSRYGKMHEGLALVLMLILPLMLRCSLMLRLASETRIAKRPAKNLFNVGVSASLHGR